MDYAIKRKKITPNAIKIFHIGAAPDKPNLLFTFLTKRKVFPESSGKSRSSCKRRNGYIDRFRGRLIFPIFTYTGRVSALAGRAIFLLKKSCLPTDRLQSTLIPETPIYHKRSSLLWIKHHPG
jgi:DNA primase